MHLRTGLGGCKVVMTKFGCALIRMHDKKGKLGSFCQSALGPRTVINTFGYSKTRPIVSDGRVPSSGRREPRLASGKTGLGELPAKRLAAAACAAACVAFQAGAVAHHGEVAAFGAAFAFIALHAGLSDLL